MMNTYLLLWLADLVEGLTVILGLLFWISVFFSICLYFNKKENKKEDKDCILNFRGKVIIVLPIIAIKSI